MSDTRTYIVPDGQENSTNQMLPWMAMMNGGMGGFGNGMWNNPFMYLVWMWIHEKNHVEMHICKEFGIDPYSEKAAYLSGQLAKKLFKAQLRNWIR